MNLAVHGLAGDIREANTYYEDLHDSRRPVRLRHGQSAVQREQGRQGPSSRTTRASRSGSRSRTTPTTSGSRLFYSALNEHGPGRVRHGQLGRRRPRHPSWRSAASCIEDRAVDVIVAVGPNFFYTVTLPGHALVPRPGKRGTEREDQVLFIDARHIYRQIDRAHRDFTPEQIEFLANIVRLWRGEDPEFALGGDDLLVEHFPDQAYPDVAGLCGRHVR